MKRIGFLFFFLGTLLSLNAQTLFGIKAGYNNSAGIYHQSNLANCKQISGIQFGVFAEKAISRSWALHSNLVFTQKGNYADYTDEKFSLDHYDYRTYRLNYLELDIALLYKITMGKNSTVKFKNFDVLKSVCCGEKLYIYIFFCFVIGSIYIILILY